MKTLRMLVAMVAIMAVVGTLYAQEEAAPEEGAEEAAAEESGEDKS